jgi:hypothetical protein
LAAITAVSSIAARLGRANFRPAATALRPSAAIIALASTVLALTSTVLALTSTVLALAPAVLAPASTVLALARAVLALPSSVPAAALLLAAAAVAPGPALTLSRAVGRVDEGGRKHDGRGYDEGAGGHIPWMSNTAASADSGISLKMREPHRRCPRSALSSAGGVGGYTR